MIENDEVVLRTSGNGYAKEVEQSNRGKVESYEMQIMRQINRVPQEVELLNNKGEQIFKTRLREYEDETGAIIRERKYALES